MRKEPWGASLRERERERERQMRRRLRERERVFNQGLNRPSFKSYLRGSWQEISSERKLNTKRISNNLFSLFLPIPFSLFLSLSLPLIHSSSLFQICLLHQPCSSSFLFTQHGFLFSYFTSFSCLLFFFSLSPFDTSLFLIFLPTIPLSLSSLPSHQIEVGDDWNKLETNSDST